MSDNEAQGQQTQGNPQRGARNLNRPRSIIDGPSGIRSHHTGIEIEDRVPMAHLHNPGGHLTLTQVGTGGDPFNFFGVSGDAPDPNRFGPPLGVAPAQPLSPRCQSDRDPRPSGHPSPYSAVESPPPNPRNRGLNNFVSNADDSDEDEFPSRQNELRRNRPRREDYSRPDPGSTSQQHADPGPSSARRPVGSEEWVMETKIESRPVGHMVRYIDSNLKGSGTIVITRRGSDGVGQPLVPYLDLIAKEMGSELHHDDLVFVALNDIKRIEAQNNSLRDKVKLLSNFLDEKYARIAELEGQPRTLSNTE